MGGEEGCRSLSKEGLKNAKNAVGEISTSLFLPLTEPVGTSQEVIRCVEHRQ